MNDNDRPVDPSPNGGPAVPVNLNTAELDELTTIPGIGPEMARRILDARPFDSFEDLQRVSGIGPQVLERVKPFIALAANDDPYRLDEGGFVEVMSTGDAEIAAPALEAPADDEFMWEEEPEAEPSEMEMVSEMPEETEALAELAEMEPEIEEAAEELEEMEPALEEAPEELEELEPVIEAEAEELEPEPVLDAELPYTAEPFEPEPEVRPMLEPAAPPANFATRSQAFWLAIGFGLLALILALVLNLGIMASLNNGELQYASPSQILELNRQLDGVRSQADILQQDLAGLRSRVDNLETLGGRMSAVEESAAQLRADLEATGGQITNLQQQTEAISGQVEDLRSQGNRFQAFFDGLNNLMDQLFAPEGTP